MEDHNEMVFEKVNGFQCLEATMNAENNWSREIKVRITNVIFI